MEIQRVHEKPDEIENSRMKLALLVIKLPHEYAHALTPAILEAELAIRVCEAQTKPLIPTISHEKTPKK